MIYISRFISICCASSLMTCSVVAQAEPGVTDSTVTVGMSAPFSGSSADFGSALKEGAEAYLRYVNDNGGIHGRKIQLLALDDAADASRTVANTKKMTGNGSVLALMSYYGVSMEAVVPLLDVASTPLIGVASGAWSLRDPPQRYLFNLRASYLDEADAIVTQLDSQGLNQIAVFYQNDSVGRSGLSGAKNAMVRLTLRPTAIASIEPGTMNVGNAAVDIAASKPQAVVIIAPAHATADFIQKIHGFSVYPQFIALSVLADDPLLKGVRAQVRGLGLSQVMPDPWAMSLPVTKQYLTLLKQYSNVAPSYYGLEGFLAAKLTVEAIRRAGKYPTREKLVSALESQYDLGGYHVSYSSNSRNGSRFVEMSVISRDGRIVR